MVPYPFLPIYQLLVHHYVPSFIKSLKKYWQETKLPILGLYHPITGGSSPTPGVSSGTSPTPSVTGGTTSTPCVPGGTRPILHVLGGTSPTLGVLDGTSPVPSKQLGPALDSAGLILSVQPSLSWSVYQEIVESINNAHTILYGTVLWTLYILHSLIYLPTFCYYMCLNEI